MKAPKTGGPTLPPAIQPAADEASSRPIQKHISNWERDLVETRSAARKEQSAQTELRHGMTILSGLLGVGAMLIGQPLLAIGIWGAGILVAPGLAVDQRNDRDR